MKITFATDWSLDWGVPKIVWKSVDVAKRVDLNKTNGCVDELSVSLEKVNKRLKAVEKRLACVEKLLASVDTRLRDDCRAIFADVIRDALLPAFVAMEQISKIGVHEVMDSDVSASAEKKKAKLGYAHKKTKVAARTKSVSRAGMARQKKG